MNSLRITAIRALSKRYQKPYNFFEHLTTKEHPYSYVMTFRGDDGEKYHFTIPKNGGISAWQESHQ